MLVEVVLLPAQEAGPLLAAPPLPPALPTQASSVRT